MKKKFLGLPWLVLLGFTLSFPMGCGNGQQPEKDNNTVVATDTIGGDGLPAPQYITDPKQKNIIGINDTLYSGDTLVIHFKTPHQGELGINDPDGNFFFVVYEFSMDSANRVFPFMRSDTFKNVSLFHFITDKDKADPWNKAFDENQPVFTKTGSYTITLSETLDTDDGTPVEEEHVFYYNKKRGE